MTTKIVKKNTSVMTAPSEDMLKALGGNFPVEEGFSEILLPRFGLISQDVTEGKGRAMKVIAEAGTFYIEVQSEETDENNKKVWERTELGTEAEGIILFSRKQLRMYDEATEKYTSSPIYDTDEDIVPLWCEKKEVARGTPKELKAMYMYTNKKGKTVSALEDNRILYVLIDGVTYQLTLRGSSMWAFRSYAKTVTVPTVLTHFNSEAKENGGIAWNQMTFKAVRTVTKDEAEQVLEIQEKMKESIELRKSQYGAQDESRAKADKDFEALGDSEEEAPTSKTKALPSGKKKNDF